MADYKIWADEVALPYIREHLDLVGFWVNIDEPAQVNGKPEDDPGHCDLDHSLGRYRNAARGDG